MISFLLLSYIPAECAGGEDGYIAFEWNFQNAIFITLRPPGSTTPQGSHGPSERVIRIASRIAERGSAYYVSTKHPRCIDINNQANHQTEHRPDLL